MRSKNAIPLFMFIFSVFVTAYLIGVLTAYFKVFPYSHIRNAARTMSSLVEMWKNPGDAYFGEYIEPTAIPASTAANHRWTIVDASAPRFPVIAHGGLNQYLELCPDQGCLAVAFDAEGVVVGSWPYRPAEIYAADITDGAYAHESIAFDPAVNSRPIGVTRYRNRDILVNFQATDGVFPFGVGVARIGEDGTPRWMRFDFSHHWSSLLANEIAYVPSLKIGDANLQFSLGNKPSPLHVTLNCSTGHPQLDIIQLIDASGSVTDQIELVPLFLNSNWAGLLPETTDPCDPLHLNYVDEIGIDAGPGLTAGDLVVSLRNLSRFAILDRETRRIKRVVAGGFIQQHSVQHLAGSKFLIFDNHGGDFEGPSSRIVELDLTTGVERRIFPNADTPAPHAQVFSDTAGHIDISPDQTRVLASFTHAGRCFEIDIASGRLLAIYDNIHDLSSKPEVPEDKRESAGRFVIYGMSYVRN